MHTNIRDLSAWCAESRIKVLQSIDRIFDETDLTTNKKAKRLLIKATRILNELDQLQNDIKES